MDEFASQISSQLGSSINSTSFVLSSRNIGIRVDRVNTIQTVSRPSLSHRALLSLGHDQPEPVDVLLQGKFQSAPKISKSILHFIILHTSKQEFSRVI